MNHLSPETALNRAGESRSVLYRSLFFTYVLGLAAHGFQFMNLDPSHDYLMRMALNTTVEGPVSRGRFLEPLYNIIMGPAAPLPWSAGLISLLWLSLTVYLVCRLFGLTRSSQIALVAAVLETNRSMISLYAVYLPFAGVFTVSVLAAVLAVWMWKKAVTEKNWRHLIPGALLIAASLGLYQSYLFTAVTLILLCSFQALLNREKAWHVILDGLKSIGMLLAGCAVYMAGTRIACKLTGYALAEGDYNSLSNLWANSESVADRFAACYSEVGEDLLTRAVSIWPPEAMTWITGLLCAASVILLVLLLRKRKPRLWELLTGTAILAVMPVAVNGIRLLNNECHDLMHYAFWLALLLPVILMKELGEEGPAAVWSGRAAALLLTLLAFSNIQTANLTYVQKELEFEATRDLMVNVMDRVEEQEGYMEGVTPVAFTGSPEGLLTPLEGKDRVKEITGCYGSSAISYYHTYFSYFENILQRKTNVVLMPDQLQQSPEVAAMPRYPAAGSVALVDGTVVVKLTP